MLFQTHKTFEINLISVYHNPLPFVMLTPPYNSSSICIIINKVLKRFIMLLQFFVVVVLFKYEIKTNTSSKLHYFAIKMFNSFLWNVYKI